MNKTFIRIIKTGYLHTDNARNKYLNFFIIGHLCKNSTVNMFLGSLLDNYEIL